MTECPRCGKPDSDDIHVCIPMALARRESYLRGFADGAESLTRWIKCSDRMPEKDSQILAFGLEPKNIHDNGLPYKTAIFDGKEWISDHFCESYNVIVTHWMPLPFPPAEIIADQIQEVKTIDDIKKSCEKVMKQYDGAIKGLSEK